MDDYPNNFETQEDYILNKYKWSKNIFNFGAYSPFEGVSSDQTIVLTKIGQSLGRTKKKLKLNYHNMTGLLLVIVDISNLCTVTVKKKLLYFLGYIWKIYSEWRIWKLSGQTKNQTNNSICVNSR